MKMEDLLSKRLSEAPVPPEVADNLEPVWHEAGSGMNVEQLRIGKDLAQIVLLILPPFKHFINCATEITSVLRKNPT